MDHKRKSTRNCISSSSRDVSIDIRDHIFIPWSSLVVQMVKNLPAMQVARSSIPGSGRFPGEENGNPLQYSCLENSMDRGDWQATVHRIAKSQT